MLKYSKKYHLPVDNIVFVHFTKLVMKLYMIGSSFNIHDDKTYALFMFGLYSLPALTCIGRMEIPARITDGVNLFTVKKIITKLLKLY